jgi:hypothetical protein
MGFRDDENGQIAYDAVNSALAAYRTGVTR